MLHLHTPHTQGKDPEYDCIHPGQLARLGNPVSVFDYCLDDLDGPHSGGPPTVCVVLGVSYMVLCRVLYAMLFTVCVLCMYA